MTDSNVNQFIKQARHIGISDVRIAELVKKAQEIESRGSIKKTAGSSLDNLVSNLLNEVGFDKTASSVSYTKAVLKEALDNGCSPEGSVKVAQLVLNQTKDNLAQAAKVSEISKNAELAGWTEGFVKAAMEAGYSQHEAVNAAIHTIEKEKRAFGEEHGGMPPEGMGGPESMFKQPVSQHGGHPGMPPGGHGEGEQIDPQLLQQILALIMSGQGAGQGQAAGAQQ
jgi:DNA-binding transcriptional regulator YhcF (GntR family)